MCLTWLSSVGLTLGESPQRGNQGVFTSINAARRKVLFN